MSQTPSSHQPRVDWFELFYDLVLVAAVLHGAHLFDESANFAQGLWLGVTLLILLIVWLLTTLTFNALQVDWSLRRMLTLVQMLALVVAALSISRDGGLSDTTGFVALGLAFGCVAALYWIQARRVQARRRASLMICASTGAAAVLCLIGAATPDNSAPVYANPAAYLFGASLLLAGVPLFTVYLGELCTNGDLDRQHLAERMGQLVIIAIGESFASLVLSLGAFNSIPNPVFLVLTFVVIYALWAIYFRTLLPQGVPRRAGRVRGWIASHYLLIFGAFGTATALSALTVVPFDDASTALASYRVPLPLLYVMISFVLLTWVSGVPDRRFLTLHLAATGALMLLLVVGVLVAPERAATMGLVGAAIVVADAAAAAWLSRTSRSAHPSLAQ